MKIGTKTEALAEDERAVVFEKGDSIRLSYVFLHKEAVESLQGQVKKTCCDFTLRQ